MITPLITTHEPPSKTKKPKPTLPNPRGGVGLKLLGSQVLEANPEFMQ